MDQLRDQARHVGGVFLSLLGNHEWMNAIGEHAVPYYSILGYVYNPKFFV